MRNRLSIAVLLLVMGSAVLESAPSDGFGEEGPTVAEPARLAELLRDDDPKVRQQALAGLAVGKAVAVEYRPVLRTALQDSNPAVRQLAAISLATSGVAEEPVLRELIRGMGEQMPPTYAARPQDPLAAAWALERLGEKAVPALVAAIEDEDYPGWHLAVETLGDIGPAAKPAVPLLTKAIAKREREDLAHIVRAKWRIDGDSAFARRELIPLLETPAGRQCNGAVRVLALMGADAKEAVPALIAAMQKHADDEDASNLAWALGELAPHAKDEAVPALFAALGNHRMADESARALASLQIPAEQIVAPLVRALDRSVEHDTAPASFAMALEGFGPAAKAAVPSLVRGLKHSNTVVRGVVARTLGRIGSDAKAAIPALTAALDDPYAAAEVQRALERIRGTQ